MNDISVTRPKPQRRRFSADFKARIVAQCLEPNVSVSRIALDNNLNTNMVRRWIREAQRSNQPPSVTPGFMPISLPVVSGTANASDRAAAPAGVIRIEIPLAGASVVVEWPVDHAHQCAALIRDLLR